MAEAAGSGGCEQQKAAGGQGALASGAATAPLQPRRKFSLPWFRQSSVGISTASKRLPKQHTIGGVGGPTGPNDSLGNLEVRSFCVVLFYKAVINEFGSLSPQLMLGIQWPLILRKIFGVTKIFLKSRFFLISNTRKPLKSIT